MPPATAFRERLPTLAVVGLLHAGFVWLLLNSLQIGPAFGPQGTEPSETQITLTPAAPPLQLPKKRLRRAAAGVATSVLSPYFDPFTYHSPQALQNGTQGITLALAACDPGHYDMAPTEVRAACDRIGMLIKSDPDHFGVTADVRDPTHWRRELARREAPVLAPCMSPNGFDVLYTLKCIYETVFISYDSENHRRYSE